jgi:lipoyl(octanoyl) transferase
LRRTIHAYDLGRVRYARAHALQERLQQARIDGTIGDTLLLLEHDPVITLGRGADAHHVLIDEAGRKELGVDLHETGRGGDVTFHGPGQLVGYPILDLSPDRRDVRKYVRDLAQVMINVAAGYGISAGVIPGDPLYIGVWVDESLPHDWDERAARSMLGLLKESETDLAHLDRAPSLGKLGAIGVRLSRWVTMHGFALNVRTDLAGFSRIVPCGITKVGVTSLERLGVSPLPTREEAGIAAQRAMGEIFDADIVQGDPATLPWPDEG